MELILIPTSFVLLFAVLGIVYPFKPFGKRRNALLTSIACFVLIGLVAPSPEVNSVSATSNQVTQVKDQPIIARNNVSAEYVVTDVHRRTDGMLEVSTRREGSSGLSFAVRLVQCEPLRFAYIAEGDTEAELVREPDPQLTDVVIGSISHTIAKHACETQETSKIAEMMVGKNSPTSADPDREKRVKLERDVRQAVDILLWSDAQNRYRTLSNSGLVTDGFKDEIEERMLELVRPLPSSEREANLKGYQFLATIRPNEPAYIAKIEHYKNAIKEQRQRSVAILRMDEDRVEGIKWYKHPNQPKYLNSRSTAYLYIGKKGDAGRPWLRMKVQYTSSDWLFVNRVTAWHDGIKEPLISGRFLRDNNSTIWEWMDVSPDEYQVEVLRSLANADEAILRFEGDKYRRDVVLTNGDKKAIKEVIEAYEVMRSGM